MSSQYPVPKWIEQLHAGKEEAYRILFDEYYQMLCVFAMRSYEKSVIYWK